MSLEIASHRVAQRHSGAEHDEYGHEAARQVLNQVANAPANPRHVEASKADDESGHNVKTPIPAVQGRGALPYFRNELKQSGKDDDDGGGQMSHHRQISHRIARD